MKWRASLVPVGVSLLFIFLYFIGWPPGARTPTTDTAIVAFVVDGDTIELTNGERVRYLGVDTPEFDECYFEEATMYNRELVRGKVVTLIPEMTDRDQYGRLLRYVLLEDGTDVSRELIRNGFGRSLYIEPDVSRYPMYRADETMAQQEGVGMWGQCR